MPRAHTSLPPHAWRQALVQYISAHPDRPLKARPLSRAIGVGDEHYGEFRDLTRSMLAAGELTRGPGRTLRLPAQAGRIVGVFHATRHGYGFIECPGRPDLYVPRRAAHIARDGDVVAARLLRARGRYGRPHAEIVKIVERGEMHWVGVLERSGARFVVRPQGSAPAPLVVIEDATAKAAQPGDLVVVEPLHHIVEAGVVRGVIVERLGPHTRTQTKVLGVIRRFGLPHDFPPAVRQAARTAAEQFDEGAIGQRADLRDLLTVTIDPPDARDFDDAISIERLPDGRSELGVHIADVSHFVPPGGALDVEARRRGNSAYFPGYVVPMLPELLSNGVCSLQPEQPRFTKSAFITYDRHGHVLAARFAESVIRSRARLTYQQVTAALEGRPRGIADAVLHLLKDAERLARRIRQRRLAEGMLVLNLPEVEIELDQRGHVVNAGPADTSFSHTIIEMFMVEANEAVCRRLVQAGLPQLRRVHPPPEPDAARTFARLVREMGHRPPHGFERPELQRLLEATAGKPQEPVLNYLLLRCLSQAYYSPEPIGHYALASEHYCHFTSPIRRYADLVVHRLLEQMLHVRRGRGRASAAPPHVDELAELGRSTSACERRAQQAERDAKKILLLDLMRRKVGQTFDGVISGVAPFGVFVQVRPYLAEGIVPLEDLGADAWEYDEDAGHFVGRRSGRVIAIGQPVRVRVEEVDEVRQELRLSPAEPLGVQRVAPPGREERRRGRGSRGRKPGVRRSRRGR